MHWVPLFVTTTRRMGFWDILDKVVSNIPVVGTIKDGVEAVVLEAQGKHEAAKEKALEAAIDLVSDVVTVGTFGAGYEVAAAGKAAAEAATKEIVESGAKGVGKAAMEEATKDGFSKEASRAIAVARHALEAKTQLKHDIARRHRKRHEPGERKKPSKRGEHVINNGVRRVLPKVIDHFLHHNAHYFHAQSFEQLVQQRFLTPEMSVFASHEQPLPAAIDLRIQAMVVFIPQHSDPNDVVYGETVAALTVLIGHYMNCLFKALIEDKRQRPHLGQLYRGMAETIAEVTDRMNTPGAEVYVDRQALQRWLTIPGNREVDYREARNYVAEMFTSLSPLRRATGNVVTWVLELFQAYQRLNSHLVAGSMIPHGTVKKSNRFGGNGGRPFDDNITAYDPAVVGIQAIRIRHGNQVDSIQATYILATGSTFAGGRHGGHGGRETYLQLEAGEEIIEVYGKTNHALVDQISFVTRKADGTVQIYGPFGRTGETSYSVKGQILGFYGRSGNLLDSIGFYHVPS